LAVNFPITGNALRPVYADGGIDAFVAAVDTTLSGTASLVYSTFLGGNGEEYGYGAALDCAGNAYVTGRTRSTTFITTTGGLQPGAGGGGNDTFVAKIGATRVITYAYDGVQRLTDAVECPGSVYHYGYDPASNRASETVDDVLQQQVSYAYATRRSMSSPSRVDLLCVSTVDEPARPSRLAGVRAGAQGQGVRGLSLVRVSPAARVGSHGAAPAGRWPAKLRSSAVARRGAVRRRRPVAVSQPDEARPHVGAGGTQCIAFSSSSASPLMAPSPLALIGVSLCLSQPLPPSESRR
jgi:YD repeat-containing protein